MSNFLQHLVQRQRQLQPVIRPRPQALFEPAERPFGLAAPVAAEEGITPPGAPAPSASGTIAPPAIEISAAPRTPEASARGIEPLSPEPKRPLAHPVQPPVLTTAAAETLSQNIAPDPLAAPPTAPPPSPVTAQPSTDHSPIPDPSMTALNPAPPTGKPAAAERPAPLHVSARQTAVPAEHATHLVPAAATVVDLAPPPALPPDVERPSLQDAAENQTAVSEAPPTIQVTIGRVEVRAAPAPAPKAPRRSQQSTVMSLDDYLRQRQKGKSP